MKTSRFFVRKNLLHRLNVRYPSHLHVHLEELRVQRLRQVGSRYIASTLKNLEGTLTLNLTELVHEANLLQGQVAAQAVTLVLQLVADLKTKLRNVFYYSIRCTDVQ